jgi:hypothetical protein
MFCINYYKQLYIQRYLVGYYGRVFPDIHIAGSSKHIKFIMFLSYDSDIIIIM